ncbi:MAG: Transposase [Mucilaginibacter sp.]|nr:Transposase [Mucilaginibacter sp.]
MIVYKTMETLTAYKEKGIAHFLDLQVKATLYHKDNYHGPKTPLIEKH